MKNTTLTEAQYLQIQNALIGFKVSARMAEILAETDKLFIIAAEFGNNIQEAQSALDALTNARFAK